MSLRKSKILLRDAVDSDRYNLLNYYVARKNSYQFLKYFYSEDSITVYTNIFL